MWLAEAKSNIAPSLQQRILFRHISMSLNIDVPRELTLKCFWLLFCFSSLALMRFCAR